MCKLSSFIKLSLNPFRTFIVLPILIFKIYNLYIHRGSLFTARQHFSSSSLLPTLYISDSLLIAACQPRAGGGWLRQDRELWPHRPGRDWIQQTRWCLMSVWCHYSSLLFCPGLELKHWKEMVENPRRPIVHWHVLKVRVSALCCQ